MSLGDDIDKLLREEQTTALSVAALMGINYIVSNTHGMTREARARWIQQFTGVSGPAAFTAAGELVDIRSVHTIKGVLIDELKG